MFETSQIICVHPVYSTIQNTTYHYGNQRFTTIIIMPWLTDSYISARFLTRGLLITLMMEAASTSETLVNFYQTTWRYNPEDSHLHNAMMLESFPSRRQSSATLRSYSHFTLFIQNSFPM
jgi:hypothetical protein